MEVVLTNYYCRTPSYNANILVCGIITDELRIPSLANTELRCIISYDNDDRTVTHFVLKATCLPEIYTRSVQLARLGRQNSLIGHIHNDSRLQGSVERVLYHR